MKLKVNFPICLAALLLAACHHPAAQITSNGASLQAARDALNEGAAGTALAIARGVLASQPHNVAALSQAGDAEATLGDRLAASASYKQALVLAPRDVHARLGEGKLLIRDNLPGAEASFRAVLADSANDPLALNDLGYVLDLQDKHRDAQTYYEAALTADPDRVSTRVNLALSFALDGQPERAEQILHDIVTGSSASRKIRLDYAVAQVIAGHERDAEQTLCSDLSPAEVKSALNGIGQLRMSRAQAN